MYAGVRHTTKDGRLWFNAADVASLTNFYMRPPRRCECTIDGEMYIDEMWLAGMLSGLKFADGQKVNHWVFEKVFAKLATERTLDPAAGAALMAERKPNNEVKVLMNLLKEQLGKK